MRKNSDISKERLESFVEQFYNYFENGYVFEEFLKVYLEKIGLDEVTVTQRSSDGGIDLKAIRYGVGELNECDITEYYVQAKRNKPGTKIAIEKVRALRGVMPSGAKGIFITTAGFSANTLDFAIDDPTRPIILLDGKTLVSSCIDNEIGFVFVPRFSEDAMNSLMNSAPSFVTDKEQNNNIIPLISVEKQISTNDIRARILRVPKAILEQLGNRESAEIEFVGVGMKKLKLDKTRTYFGGITEIYRNRGLIADDGAFCPKRITWNYYQDGRICAYFE